MTFKVTVTDEYTFKTREDSKKFADMVRKSSPETSIKIYFHGEEVKPKKYYTAYYFPSKPFLGKKAK